MFLQVFVYLQQIPGGEIFISQKENLAGTETYVNCHLIENPNIRTLNGFIHVVDGTLQPAVKNLLKLLENDGSFSIFVSLFSNEVRNLLSSNQTFTVFAFSDKIYNSLSQSLQQQIRERTGCVADIVKSHIFYKALCSYELDNHLFTSLAGQMTRAQALTHNGRSTIHVGRARILEKDLFAKNGVVHTVDDIIIKEELLAWDDHLSNYNEPLKDALSSVLVSSSEPITIFVPPAENRTVSSEFAANHLISSRIIKVSNEPTTIITNANSTVFLIVNIVFFAGHFINRSPLAIRISMGEFDRTRTEQIGCSRIIEDSVHACNAILHFIDKPLPMVHDNFDTFLAGRPDLSRFYKLWKESSLSNLLWRKDTISVFIPVDDAFSNNYFKKVLTNRNELDIFVKRYIISEPLCKHDLLRNKNEIKIEIHQNLNGETLRTTVTEDNVLLLDGAKVQMIETLSTLVLDKESKEED
uniref:FAS1 domain-containing protein n=1 Tax=Heterorhabditis bacteriophora TaxID=37862 RepID=A0A1I7WBV9_HETBA